MATASRHDLFPAPLRPVRPGRCTFFSDQERLPRWHPIAQDYLVLSQLNHLRIFGAKDEPKLDLANPRSFREKADGGYGSDPEALLRDVRLPETATLNLEKGSQKKLAQDEVAARLLGDAKTPGPMADIGPALDRAAREEVIMRLAKAEGPEDLIAWLMDQHGLSRDAAERVEKTPLAAG